MDKTELLSSSARKFQKQSKALKNVMWCVQARRPPHELPPPPPPAPLSPRPPQVQEREDVGAHRRRGHHRPVAHPLARVRVDVREVRAEEVDGGATEGALASSGARWSGTRLVQPAGMPVVLLAAGCCELPARQPQAFNACRCASGWCRLESV